MPTLKSLRGLPPAILSQLRDQPVRRKAPVSAQTVTGPGKVVAWLKDEGKAVSCLLAIPLVSEINLSQHWRVRQRRAKAQRAQTRAALGWLAGRGRPTSVSVCRVAARSLDPNGNLQTSAKHLLDELADILGFDDASTEVLWAFTQRKPAKGEPCGVELRISWAPVQHCPACGQPVLP